MKYAIIKNNEVINVIIWDGKTKFEYPFDYDDIVQSNELQIGMILIDGVWIQQETDTTLDVTE